MLTFSFNPFPAILFPIAFAAEFTNPETADIAKGAATDPIFARIGNNGIKPPIWFFFN